MEGLSIEQPKHFNLHKGKTDILDLYKIEKNTLLKTIIETQASRIREQEENIHELSKMVAQLQSLKASLEETLEEFRRQFYGVKSEKTSSKSKDDSRL